MRGGVVDGPPVRDPAAGQSPDQAAGDEHDPGQEAGPADREIEAAGLEGLKPESLGGGRGRNEGAGAGGKSPPSRTPGTRRPTKSGVKRRANPVNGGPSLQRAPPAATTVLRTPRSAQ